MGNEPTHLDAVCVLGSRVHLVTATQTVDQIERWIGDRNGGCRRVVVTGFHGLWEAHKDASYREVLNSAELWVPDGIAPVWVARIRGQHNVRRAPGTEIMSEFFQRANGRGYSSYFYGDTETTLSNLRDKLARRWPGHRVAGTFSPPFRTLTAQEDQEAVERINEARPDVLWVGLGAPRQDRWIYERLSRLKVPVAIGVGAAFGFIAGTVQRCPEWMGSMGLEWVHRFAKEPKKLWKRDLIDGPQFVFHLGMELAGLRHYSEQSANSTRASSSSERQAHS
jgi:N-acetylglucosaminyldiphosphoundecaprenol N-acetyl-beta-D-mannosaminyltransferase